MAERNASDHRHAETESTVKQLQAEIEQLRASNRDLAAANLQLQEAAQRFQNVNVNANSFLSSIDIPTVFVDREMRARWFNGAAAVLFNLSEAEIGRPLDGIAQRIAGVDLLELVTLVLRSGESRQCQATGPDQHDYLLNVTPYEDTSMETEGVSVSLSDVTSIQRSVQQQAMLVELGHDVARGAPLYELFNKAVRILADGIGMEYTKVLELTPDGNGLVLRATVGLSQDLVDVAEITSSADLQPGYTLASDVPVIVEDASVERRFALPPLMEEHGVMSGMSVRIAGRGARPYGALVAFSKPPRRFSNTEVRLLSSTAAFLSTAIAVRWEESLRAESEQRYRALADELEARVEERTRELSLQQIQLRQMNVRILTAEEHERRRIAEGLHDDVQQLLAAAHFGLQTLLQRPSPILPDEAEEVAEWVDEALAATRSFIFELSPSVLYEEGLSRAIGHLADQMLRRYRLSVEVYEQSVVDPVPENARVFIYSGIRELLFNIVKHAGVPAARVDLSRSFGEIEITVQDRGKGITVATGQSMSPQRVGMGLTSLRERAQHFGGQLLIESSPGQGTAVTLTLPLPDEEDASNDDPGSDR